MPVRPLTRSDAEVSDHSGVPSPPYARRTPCCQSSSHAKFATISERPSPVRSTTTGALMPCMQSGASVAVSALHSIRASNGPKTGSIAHVTGSNCGRQRPSSGSQKAPIGQSNESTHGSPRSVHAPDTQACSAAQQVERSAPQRTPLAHAGKHAPSAHSSPTAQQTGGEPHTVMLSQGRPASVPTSSRGASSVALGASVLPASSAATHTRSTQRRPPVQSAEVSQPAGRGAPQSQPASTSAAKSEPSTAAGRTVEGRSRMRRW
jgi:hypothetical protein